MNKKTLSNLKIAYEPCSKCSNGEMTHPEAYIYMCNICGFTYKINPAAKDNIIEILKKGILEEVKING